MGRAGIRGDGDEVCGNGWRMCMNHKTLKTISYTFPYTAHITNEEVRCHLSYRKETTSSVRTFCDSPPITRPLAHSSSSHQSSSSGLATPAKADMAPYNRARPSAP